MSLSGKRIPIEVVQAAQVVGARMRNDSFYTPQDVYKAFNEGRLSWERVPTSAAFNVTLYHGKDKRKVVVKWLPENTAVDGQGHAYEIVR